jgi:hypothetical protein
MKPFRKRKKLFELKKTDSLPSNNNEELLSTEILKNEQLLKENFQGCSDFTLRPILENGEAKILIIYIDGLTDTKLLDEALLKPLMFEGSPKGMGKDHSLSDEFENKLVAVGRVRTVSKASELINGVLKGDVGVLVDGKDSGFLADVSGFEKRAIQEASSEVVIRGPRDGFTESLRTNTSLLRRRIKSTRLKMESISIGELSQTDIVISYIEGIAPDSLLDEVRSRLNRIRIDGILESEYIEEFIEDVPFSPFPQIQSTERPDTVIANLLEGKVGILVDNTPFALILPMTFWSGIQATEDYYERFIYTTFIRLIRYVLLNVSLFLPSLYVALTTFHPKLIPTELLISITASREIVPFPAIIEALLMEFMFEGLREAGVRLPKPVGSAVSIVGALVIGQAAVEAGIVSAPMVIVVATTGIASFAIPHYNFGTAFRMIRYVMLILAGCFGIFGIGIGFIAITIHLVNLRSFGVPYFSPVAPQIPSNLIDTLIRAPRWAFTYRPEFLSGLDKLRIPKGQRPSQKRGKKGT